MGIRVNIIITNLFASSLISIQIDMIFIKSITARYGGWLSELTG